MRQSRNGHCLASRLAWWVLKLVVGESPGKFLQLSHHSWSKITKQSALADHRRLEIEPRRRLSTHQWLHIHREMCPIQIVAYNQPFAALSKRKILCNIVKILGLPFCCSFHTIPNWLVSQKLTSPSKAYFARCRPTLLDRHHQVSYWVLLGYPSRVWSFGTKNVRLQVDVVNLFEYLTIT